MIAGQALFHIMGDWMKGEWLAAGKVPGVDFGCEVIPGALAVPVTSDAMGILGGQSAEKDKAELDLVAAFVDPIVSAKANQQKGSTSPRADAPTEFRDACNQVAMDAMNKPNGAVKNPFNVITGDWNNGIWTAMYNFWSDKNQTTDDAVAAAQGRVRPDVQLTVWPAGRTSQLPCRSSPSSCPALQAGPKAPHPCPPIAAPKFTRRGRTLLDGSGRPAHHHGSRWL